jgi:hypothetical protein
MSYRTVTFKEVLYAVAYIAGLDPETNLNANEASAMTEYVNQGARAAVESKDWPELTNIEQRTPSAGLVGYAQSGQTPIGIVYQVYYANPAGQRFPRERGYYLGPLGIQLHPDAPSSVWVRFGIQPPVFSSEEWVSSSAGGSYAEGAVIYDSVSGNCYSNLTGTNTSTAPSSDGTNWAVVPMPYIIADAVKAYALQLMQREEGQTQKADDETKRALTLLQAAQMQQQGKIPIAGQGRNYNGGQPQASSQAS